MGLCEFWFTCERMQQTLHYKLYIFIYSYIIVYCDCEIREQFSGKISEMVLNTYFLLTKVDFPTWPSLPDVCFPRFWPSWWNFGLWSTLQLFFWWGYQVEIRDAHPLAPCLLARAAPSLRICMSCAQPPGMDPERNHRERFVLEHATIEAGMSLTADQTSTRVRVWQKRCLEKSGLGKTVGCTHLAKLQPRFFHKMRQQLVWLESREGGHCSSCNGRRNGFRQQRCVQELTETCRTLFGRTCIWARPVFSDQKTETPKPAAVEADQKIRKAKEQEKTAKKKEYDRLFDLTPSALKALLPGGGEIPGVFWMRFHPIKKFWRADYPIGAFVLETRLCLFWLVVL